MKSSLARAARVLLVFALVFWGSFRVEAFAFASMAPTKLDAHIEDGDKLTDLVVYELTTAEGKQKLSKVAAASDAAEEAAADGESADGKAADGKKASIQFEKPTGERQFVAVPCWNGKKPNTDPEKEEVEAAAFVKWESSDEKLASVDFDEKKGVATLTAKAATGDEPLTVTCELDLEKLAKEQQEALGIEEGFPEKGKAKARFQVSVPEDSERVSKVELIDEDGKSIAESGADIVLSGALPQTYSFQVRVTTTKLSGAAGATYESIADAEDAGIELAWSLDPDDGTATVDDGTLSMKKAGKVTVDVAASLATESAHAQAVVKTEESGGSDPGDPGPGDDDPKPLQPVEQGESHPQDTLTVVSNARVAVSDDEAATPTGEADGSADEGASGSTGGQPGSAEPGPSSSSSTSVGASGDAQPIEKTYTADELLSLGAERATYTMYDGGDFVTVTGVGPYLIALLKDVGIDNTAQVESLAFENYAGVSTTVNWADLEAANIYYPHVSEDKADLSDAEVLAPIIAVDSLVRGYGDGTGEGADAAAGDDSPRTASSSSSSGSSSSSSASSASGAGEGAADPLLDNARFRLLFGSTSPARAIADPDALRWISKITVNVKPAEAEPEDPDFDTDIDVSVEYVPVPIGAPAVFSALPNTAIRDARFDFTWERSTDGGKTWEPIDGGNVQVLRVLTTSEGVEGKHQYRVVMDTDATDKNGRENVSVTSKPVTMVEGDGLAVVLEYDPPIAGQTAFFQTTLYGAKKGDNVSHTYTYTWQQSQDGGAHWRDIAGRTGPSLAVPTEPIDPNAERAEGEEVVPITYVRVIVTEDPGSDDERVAVSEAVPLTVHVGDSNEQGDTPTAPSTTDPGTEKDASPTDSPEAPETPEPTKKKPKVTPVKDITPEPSEAPRSATVPTAPSANGTKTQQIDPSQLYINEAVSDLVAEQQEAVEDYVEDNVPGARWMNLSTVQATQSDVRNILADNPFAPFVLPLGLGITAVGGVEKLVAFRRQTK